MESYISKAETVTPEMGRGVPISSGLILVQGRGLRTKGTEENHGRLPMKDRKTKGLSLKGGIRPEGGIIENDTPSLGKS